MYTSKNPSAWTEVWTTTWRTRSFVTVSEAKVLGDFQILVPVFWADWLRTILAL